MKLDEAMSHDMVGQYVDDRIDSEVEPWYDRLHLHTPPSPLTKLWDFEYDTEQDRVEKEKSLPTPLHQMSVTYPWLALHYKDCAKDIPVIADGKHRMICRQCAPEWELVADVEGASVITSEAA